MDGHALYVYSYAKNNHFSIDFAIFTKASRTNRRTNRWTDRRTNGPTDQRTDIPSYRDAIAASKKKMMKKQKRSNTKKDFVPSNLRCIDTTLVKLWLLL